MSFLFEDRQWWNLSSWSVPEPWTPCVCVAVKTNCLLPLRCCSGGFSPQRPVKIPSPLSSCNFCSQYGRGRTWAAQSQGQNQSQLFSTCDFTGVLSADFHSILVSTADKKHLSIFIYFNLSSDAIFDHQLFLFINTVTMFGLLKEQCN